MRHRALILLLMSACGGALSAKDYDQSCNFPVECAPVRDGDVCAGCDCPSAAINVRDRARYAGDRRAITCLGSRPVCRCVGSSATCEAGKCVLITL